MTLRQQIEDKSCKGQHNFVFSFTCDEPMGSDSTIMQRYYFVICTKCGQMKKTIIFNHKLDEIEEGLKTKGSL